MTSRDNRYGRYTRQKATLFCTDCEYRGQMPRGWIEVCTDRVCSVVCPRCGATIDERTAVSPRPPAEAD